MGEGRGAGVQMGGAWAQQGSRRAWEGLALAAAVTNATLVPTGFLVFKDSVYTCFFGPEVPKAIPHSESLLFTPLRPLGPSPAAPPLTSPSRSLWVCHTRAHTSVHGHTPAAAPACVPPTPPAAPTGVGGGGLKK